MGAIAPTPALVPTPDGYPSFYRPRDARASHLYQLLQAYYQDVKAVWEEHFEKKYGFWRGFVDTVVARYLDAFEFIARVLTQIPEPRKHNIHYFGAYASRARALRKKHGLELERTSVNHGDATTDGPELTTQHRAALRKRWANLIRRVHNTDPLLCTCGGYVKR